MCSALNGGLGCDILGLMPPRSSWEFASEYIASGKDMAIDSWIGGFW